MIKAVLAQRHAQEMADLETQYAAEKRMMVNEALNKLNAKYEPLRTEMSKRHNKELFDLQVCDKSNLTIYWLFHAFTALVCYVLKKKSSYCDR